MSDRCPRCDSRRVARIVYGMVGPEMLEDDDVVLGGCVVGPGMPTWACPQCDHRWADLPVPLQWPDPRAHDDGELVTVSGTVGRVVLDATRNGHRWGEFELLVEHGLPRLHCHVFPSALAVQPFPPMPDLEVTVTGRISLAGQSGVELHVREWEPRSA